MGSYFRAAGLAATALPVGAALLVAAVRICDRRAARYIALASSVAIGTAYTLIDALSFAETFHFVEYGLLAWLVYRAVPTRDDGSLILLPLLAGVLVGTLDEWFQWFIPIRAGEVRDIFLDGIASGCGLLFAIAIDPPAGPVGALRRGPAVRLGRCGGAALVLLGLFVLTVHVGHDVRDPEIGTFRSRYTGAELAALARDRATRWRARPPLVLRRLAREDQYLTEGLWHVLRRNQAWSAGDVSDAWRENRILERFYVPVLEVPTYADPLGHRWSVAQRAEAAEWPGVDRAPSESDAYPYLLYVWPAGW